MPPGHTRRGRRRGGPTRERLDAAPSLRCHRRRLLLLSQYVESGSPYAEGRQPDRVGHPLKNRVEDLGDFSEAIRRCARGRWSIQRCRAVGRRRASGSLDDPTEREREVLALMAEGRSNQAICDALFLAPKTVEAHIANIFSKLELLPAPDDHRRVLAVLADLRG